MKCNQCGEEVCGFPTGDPKEDICSDCAYPVLRKASKHAAETVEFNHWQRTGEFKSCGELFRRVLGMK